MLVSFASISQIEGRNLLIERYSAFDSLDMVRQESEDSTYMDMKNLLDAQQKVIDVDNQIISSLIEDQDGFVAKSKDGLLFDQNRKQKKALEVKATTITNLYIILAVLILLLLVIGYLYFQKVYSYKEFTREFHSIKEKYQHDFVELEELRSKMNSLDTDETELINELDSNIEHYRKELEKAGKFINDLRNEKILAESELEEIKLQVGNLHAENTRLSEELSIEKNKDNSIVQKFEKERQRSEDNFNELHAQTRRLKEERENLKLELAEAIRIIGKEKEDKETVKKELLGWIENKKDAYDLLEKKQNEKLQQIKTLRFELNTYIAERSDLQQKLEEARNLVNDAERVKQEEHADLIKKVEDSSRELTRIVNELEKMKNENSDLSYQLELSNRSKKTLEENTRLHEMAMRREIEKRKKLEDQLSNILNNLKQ
jgi:predicted  nucleic acid-binding Zn-ribbon protein